MHRLIEQIRKLSSKNFSKENIYKVKLTLKIKNTLEKIKTVGSLTSAQSLSPRVNEYQDFLENGLDSIPVAILEDAFCELETIRIQLELLNNIKS